MKDEPVTVTLCGSTRFMAYFIDASRRETLAGKIVISVGLFGHQEGIDMLGPVKAMLDELHLRKIDKSEEILVIDPVVPCCPACHKPLKLMTGAWWRCDFCEKLLPVGEEVSASYIGESTRREIAYAVRHGKRVRYLSQETA